MGEAYAALAAILLAATAARAGDPAVPCERYRTPAARVGRAPAALIELSGLAASRRHDGGALRVLSARVAPPRH